MREGFKNLIPMVFTDVIYKVSYPLSWRVFPRIPQFEVIHAVIGTVAVKVMDIFKWFQLSFKMHLHNSAMFRSVFTCSGDKEVCIALFKLLSALPKVVILSPPRLSCAFSTAKMVLKGLQRTLSSVDFFTAVTTIYDLPLPRRSHFINIAYFTNVEAQ